MLEAIWPNLVPEPVGVDKAADTELVLVDVVVAVVVAAVVVVALTSADELAGFGLHLVTGDERMFFELIVMLTVNCFRILPHKHLSWRSSSLGCLLLLRQ